MTDIENSPVTTGDALRARRQELGLTLEEVAAKTRIRRIYLEALEEDRGDDIFPGEAYRRGFLRTYAELLGLGLEDLPAGRPASDSGAAPEGGDGERRTSLHGALIALFALLLVLGAVGMTSLLRSPAPPPSPRAPAADVPNTSVPDSLPAASGADVVEAPSGAPAEPAAGSAKEGGDPSAAIEDDVIRLRALGPNRLELVLDSRPTQHYELKPETELSWKVRRSALLRIEDPSAVQIWFGGRLVDAGGKSQILLQARTGAETGRP